jgi:hypothetical protein
VAVVAGGVVYFSDGAVHKLHWNGVKPRRRCKTEDKMKFLLIMLFVLAACGRRTSDDYYDYELYKGKGEAAKVA